jgi:hypothetical protein
MNARPLSSWQKNSSARDLGYVVPVWNVDHLEFGVRSGGYEKFSDAQNASKILREQGLELTSVIMTGRDEEQIRP